MSKPISWRPAIIWRGQELTNAESEPAHWFRETHIGYIGVSCDDDDPGPQSKWSAVIECSGLEVEGAGPDAASALDSAREKMRQELITVTGILEDWLGIRPWSVSEPNLKGSMP